MELLTAIKTMRKAQRDYYQLKTTEALQYSIKTEATVDALVNGQKSNLPLEDERALITQYQYMRRAQKKYYSNKQSAWAYVHLAKAKKAEADLDKLITQTIINRIQIPLL